MKEYIKSYNEELYKEKTGFFSLLFERFKFIFEKENYYPEIKNIILYAYLLSQLKKEPNKEINMVLIDSVNYKILQYGDKDFKKIHEEVQGLPIKLDNMNEINKSLQLIEEKMKNLKKYIENSYKDKNNQNLYIIY